MIVYVDGPDVLAYLAEQADPLVVEGQRDRNHDNLTRWLGRYCEMAGCRAVLVFDDFPAADVRTPTEHRAQVKVVNLPHGVEAVSEIGGAANRSAVEERTFAVSTDHRLWEALQHGKATVLSPAHFVARARRAMGHRDEMTPDEPDEKFTGLTAEEVDFWLEYFGDGT